MAEKNVEYGREPPTAELPAVLHEAVPWHIFAAADHLFNHGLDEGQYIPIANQTYINSAPRAGAFYQIWKFRDKIEEAEKLVTFNRDRFNDSQQFAYYLATYAEWYEPTPAGRPPEDDDGDGEPDTRPPPGVGGFR